MKPKSRKSRDDLLWSYADRLKRLANDEIEDREHFTLMTDDLGAKSWNQRRFFAAKNLVTEWADRGHCDDDLCYAFRLVAPGHEWYNKLWH